MKICIFYFLLKNFVIFHGNIGKLFAKVLSNFWEKNQLNNQFCIYSCSFLDYIVKAFSLVLLWRQILECRSYITVILPCFCCFEFRYLHQPHFTYKLHKEMFIHDVLSQVFLIPIFPVLYILQFQNSCLRQFHSTNFRHLSVQRNSEHHRCAGAFEILDTKGIFLFLLFLRWKIIFSRNVHWFVFAPYNIRGTYLNIQDSERLGIFPERKFVIGLSDRYCF